MKKLSRTVLCGVFVLSSAEINCPAQGSGNASFEDLIIAPAPAAATSPAIPKRRPNVKAVAGANNKFAVDYYLKLKAKEDGNIFYSPFSISAALAMTYEGARGKTAEEMRAVLYFPEDAGLRRTQYAAIFNEINKKDKQYKLSTANALWAQKDYIFLPKYFNAVKRYYGGEAVNLDFKKDPEGSRQTINSWIEARTNNKIKDLIPSGSFNGPIKLVLTNAVYFKGNWVNPFDKNRTKEEDFRISANDIVKVQMMRMREITEFNYGENNICQVIELPYAGDELSMLVLLPKNDGLAALESAFSVKSLTEWVRNLKKRKVMVNIPRFKFETKYFMAKDLKAMGMPTAFKWPGADFSGMDGTQYLFISQVIHQAFVEVNEEGTEAAAATAVEMMAGGMPTMPKIYEFRADHPFLFLIREKYSGNILFFGRVVNPAL